MLAVIAFATVFAAGCSKQVAPPAQRPAPEVSVVMVQPQTIPYVVSFVAQTESSRQVDIVARVSGFLDRIAYKEGDLVKDGQLLFQLDPKPFQAQLEAARGEMQAQKARFTTAEATLARVKPLAAQNALSQADLDKAQGEFDASKAAVFAAQAKVTEAELNLGYATIRSPVTGLASRAAQREGAYLNSMSADSKLTYVAAIDPVWVIFSVSQNQFAYGEHALLRLAASYTFGISRNYPFKDGNKRTSLVVAELFLMLNGFELTATDAECVTTFQQRAAGDLTEEQLTAWIADRTAPVA